MANSIEQTAEQVQQLQQENAAMGERLSELATQVQDLSVQAAEVAATAGDGFFLQGLTVFILAIFVGYYVVWHVTPALHSPLMAVTNAISSVIIVGALIAAGPEGFGFSQFMGFLAVILAAVNIFGGFVVAQRMLAMYKKKS